jgi:hypothetical protein
MKTNYQAKNTKLIYLLTFFVMLAQSCTKDPIATNGTPITKFEYLTAGALNQTPYFTNTAFDTISFASDKGDTLSFVKTKTDTSWYCENQSLASNYKICYQTIHNTYTTIKGVGSFDVKHSRKIDYKDMSDIINFHINNTYFLCGDEQIGYIGYWTFKKVVTIKNRSFNDVIVLYPNSYDSLEAESYINKDKGLFYFNDKVDNINYTIIN